MDCKFFIRVLPAIALAAFLSATPTAANAALILSLGTGNSAISGYPTPYGTVSIDRTDSTNADVVFSAGAAGSYSYKFGGEGVVDVNVNATLWTISGLTSNGTLGDLSDGGSNNVSTFGVFNQTFDNFDGSGHAVTQVSFHIHNDSGVWLNDGSVLAANASGLFAAAHIFVYDSTGANVATGFAANDLSRGGGQGDVPEPMSLAIWGLGMGCACVVGMRRRKV